MHSEKMDKIAPAMVKVQGAIKHAIKDSLNPFFKKKYADLAAVWEAGRAPLQENGIALLQMMDQIDGKPALTTMLLHESGQFISGTFAFDTPTLQCDWESKGKKYTANGPDPQATGIINTYYRRYGFASAIGILADDDDGEGAMKRPEEGSPQEVLRAADEKAMREELRADIYAINQSDDPEAAKLTLIDIGEKCGYKNIPATQQIKGQMLDKMCAHAAKLAKDARPKA